MKNKKCSECGKTFDGNSEICPDCTEKNATKQRSEKKNFNMRIVFTITFFVISLITVFAICMALSGSVW